MQGEGRATEPNGTLRKVVKVCGKLWNFVEEKKGESGNEKEGYGIP